MKLKSSVKMIHPDAIFLLFVIAVLVVLPLRVYQLTTIIDPATGFYTDLSNMTIVLLYTVAGAFMLFMLVLSFLSKNIPASIPPKGIKVPLGTAAVLLSVSMLIDAITQFSFLAVSFFESNNTGIPISFSEIISEIGAIPIFLQTVFALLSCIYFIIFAISYLTGKTTYAENRLLALAPLAWAIFRIIYRFMRAISFTRVSELLFELFALVMLMMFFIAFARISSNVNRKGNMWSIFGSGLSAAMFLLIVSVPRFVLMLIGRNDLIVENSPFEIADLACAVFIIVYVLTVLRAGYKLEDEEDQEIEPKDESSQLVDGEIIEPDSNTQNEQALDESSNEQNVQEEKQEEEVKEKQQEPVQEAVEEAQEKPQEDLEASEPVENNSDNKANETQDKGEEEPELKEDTIEDLEENEDESKKGE